MTVIYIVIGVAIAVDVAINIGTRMLLRSVKHILDRARAVQDATDALIKGINEANPS